MKILILITGIGLGHTLREEAIIQEILKKHPKAEIRIVTYGNAYNFFHNKFTTYKIIGPKFPDYTFEVKIRDLALANISYPLVYYFEARKILNVSKLFKPDLIISDFEPMGILISKIIKKPLIAIFNFNLETLKDYERTNKLSTTLKIQASYVKRYYKLSHKGNILIPTLFGHYKSKTHYKYINPIIRYDPKELKDEKVLMKKLGFAKKPILISTGGSNFGSQIIESILKIAKEFDEEFVIFGYLHSTVKLLKNVRVFSFKNNFLEYLKISKGIVTLGGYNTIAEALVFKKPALIFPVKNHLEQLLNAYPIEMNKLSLVKHLNKISPEIIRDHLKEFIKKIPIIQKNLSKLSIKPTGAKEAVYFIDKFK
ncbi:MAG: hypothetical protein HYS32_02910 [Candidatus Woesearchaeota archaeon]|nr:MAG: hypothetical protein HYS32_02910 [Candidatus Woesearchaeota archaeon]